MEGPCLFGAPASLHACLPAFGLGWVGLGRPSVRPSVCEQTQLRDDAVLAFDILTTAGPAPATIGTTMCACDIIQLNYCACLPACVRACARACVRACVTTTLFKTRLLPWSEGVTYRIVVKTDAPPEEDPFDEYEYVGDAEVFITNLPLDDRI